MANATAYTTPELITTIKSFKVHAPKACAIKIFTAVIVAVSE
jgi:hypothetical protein